MFEKEMIIDAKTENLNGFVRYVVDRMELAIRDGEAFFSSRGRQMTIPLERIVQIYTT